MYLYYKENTSKEDSRSLLKQVLKRYIKKCGGSQLFEGELQIAKTLQGKPYLQEPLLPEKIFFSVSHTKSYWVCLIGGEELGIDIEEKTRGIPEERILSISQRFFSKEEFACVKELGKEVFYSIWVRKEAFIKCKGTGLSENLRSFSTIDENGSFKKTVDGLFLSSLALPLPVYCALCTKEKEIKIKEIESV